MRKINCPRKKDVKTADGVIRKTACVNRTGYKPVWALGRKKRFSGKISHGENWTFNQVEREAIAF